MKTIRARMAASDSYSWVNLYSCQVYRVVHFMRGLFRYIRKTFYTLYDHLKFVDPSNEKGLWKIWGKFRLLNINPHLPSSFLLVTLTTSLIILTLTFPSPSCPYLPPPVLSCPASKRPRKDTGGEHKGEADHWWRRRPRPQQQQDLLQTLRYKKKLVYLKFISILKKRKIQGEY